MTREFLKKLFEGLDIKDDIYAAIMGENGKDAEARKTAEAEVARLGGSLKERDTQLEALTKSTGDVEALKKQITELQAANAAAAEAHAAEVKQLRFDTALTAALTGAKARNPDTVKPLLKSFLEKAEMDGDSIKGLDKEIERLVGDKSSAFLFEPKQAPAAGFKGVTPAEGLKGTETEEYAQAEQLIADAINGKI